MLLGHFIGGLLTSGDLFLWHKDSDLIKHIKGLAEIKENVSPTQPVGGGGGDATRQRGEWGCLVVTRDGTLWVQCLLVT